MYDVIALTNGSGYYRTIIKVPSGQELPKANSTMAALGYFWVCVAHNVTEDDAYAIMSQYPHATQMKRIVNG